MRWNFSLTFLVCRKRVGQQTRPVAPNFTGEPAPPSTWPLTKFNLKEIKTGLRTNNPKQ